MSDADQTAIDVLLPGARVAVFSDDTETLEAAKALAQDWRFARVQMHIQTGTVETAITHFQQNDSADLIIVQTNQIDESFTERLGELSSYCHEGTSAIIIGPVNDVYLYRRLIAMGVSDYLVRPVTADILTQIIAKTLITKLGISSSRLIATVGAKGGVGTTSITEMLALGAADVLDQKTLLMDAAGGWSSLSVGMGFDPSATMAQIIRAVESKNEDALARMIYKVSDKLSVLAGGADAMFAATSSPEQYEKLLDQLMMKFPVLLLDLSGADSALKRVAMTRANKILLVTTPSVTALRAARSILKEIGDLRGGHTEEVSLIVNQSGVSKAHEVKPKDIEEALESKIAAQVSFLPALFLGHESELPKILKDREGQQVIKSTLLPLLRAVLSRGDDEKAEAGKKSGGGSLGGFLSKLTMK